MPQAFCGELLGVSERTVRNWETGKVSVPYSAYRLMRVSVAYELPGDDWRGWSIRGDTLWSPAGQAFEVWGMGYLALVFSMARQWLRDRGYQGRIPAEQSPGISRPGRAGGRSGVPVAAGRLQPASSNGVASGPQDPAHRDRIESPAPQLALRGNGVNLTDGENVDTLTRSPSYLANAGEIRIGGKGYELVEHKVIHYTKYYVNQAQLLLWRIRPIERQP